MPATAEAMLPRPRVAGERGKFARRWLAIAAALGCASLGCKEDKPPPPESTETPASVVSKADPGPPPPWFVGDWRGSAKFEARLPPPLAEAQARGKKVEVPANRQPLGPLTMVVKIDEDQNVGGRVQLGSEVAGQVRGALDDETLRLSVQHESEQHGPIRGVLVAKRKDESFDGTLQLSSGDSAHVWSGPLKLEHVPIGDGESD